MWPETVVTNFVLVCFHTIANARLPLLQSHNNYYAGINCCLLKSGPLCGLRHTQLCSEGNRIDQEGESLL